MARIEKHVRKTGLNNNMVSNISKWKNEIIQELIRDEELCKLLKYNKPEASSMRKLSEDERYALVNENIFGYRYIPDVADKSQSFITLSVSKFVPQEGYRQFSDDYLMGYIFFYIFVDIVIMETDNGYRQDLIADRIQNIFQGSRKFGVGELKLESFVENWEHHNKFGGYVMGFKIVDFK